jgi:hypothetical protein
MVQAALLLLSQALHALLALAVPILVVLALLFTGLLLFAFFDRGRFHDAVSWVGLRSVFLAQWALALLALGTGILATDIAHRSVQARLGSQVNARYTNAADPDTSETVQVAPSATYLTERTYTRTLVIPPELLRLVRREGVQVLAPYLQDPSSQNIVRLRDSFTRSGRDVVFSRQATLQAQEYITFDTSRVSADLNFIDTAGGRQSSYNASFEAGYSFKNPLDTPAVLRFTFPLPDGSGTLSGFTMTVNGVGYTAADLSSGGNTWEGRVPPGGAVNVRVTYKHQGSRGWNYNLSQRRELVKNFELTLHTNQNTKYQRYSLFPTQVERVAFSGAQTLHWKLENAITAQNVAVVFGQGSVRETLNKLYAFVPFSLAARKPAAAHLGRRQSFDPFPAAAGTGPPWPEPGLCLWRRVDRLPVAAARRTAGRGAGPGAGPVQSGPGLPVAAAAHRAGPAHLSLGGQRRAAAGPAGNRDAGAAAAGGQMDPSRVAPGFRSGATSRYGREINPNRLTLGLTLLW